MASFGQTFNAARKAGKKTFTWQGKSYTTETREDRAKKVGSTRPARNPKTTSARPPRSRRKDAERALESAVTKRVNSTRGKK